MDLSAHRDISERKNTILAELKECRLCPRDCNIDRLSGKIGFCGLDFRARCFREMIHNGEEKQLIPSHQVYFAGCNLRCEYCTVDEWNRSCRDIDGIEADKLAKIIADRRRQGAKTLNFLGGEPSVSILGIVELLELVAPDTTVVWNSNMYYRRIVGDVLEGLADVFLADFKCFKKECCQKILGASDYSEFARSNIRRACEYSDVIVRLLALPGHFECCSKPILEWIAAEIPSVKVSLRLDYIPPIPAQYSPSGYLEDDERNMVLEKAEQLKLNLIE